MKRSFKILLTVLVVTSLMVTLTACGSKDSGEGATYKDGTYVGQSEKREFGYEEAEVTIVDGQIADIVLKRMTPEGDEVNYDEWTGDDDKPNLKQFKEDVAKEMLEKQSYEVDTIATATETVEGWKVAVKNALEQAK